MLNLKQLKSTQQQHTLLSQMRKRFKTVVETIKQVGYTPNNVRAHSQAAQHSPAAHVAAATVCDVHPIPDQERRGRGGGTAASLRAHALRAVRQFAWLGVGPAHTSQRVPRREHAGLMQAVRET